MARPRLNRREEPLFSGRAPPGDVGTVCSRLSRAGLQWHGRRGAAGSGHFLSAVHLITAPPRRQQGQRRAAFPAHFLPRTCRAVPWDVTCCGRARPYPGTATDCRLDLVRRTQDTATRRPASDGVEQGRTGSSRTERDCRATGSSTERPISSRVARRARRSGRALITGLAGSPGSRADLSGRCTSAGAPSGRGQSSHRAGH